MGPRFYPPRGTSPSRSGTFRAMRRPVRVRPWLLPVWLAVAGLGRARADDAPPPPARPSDDRPRRRSHPRPPPSPPPKVPDPDPWLDVQGATLTSVSERREDGLLPDVEGRDHPALPHGPGRRLAAARSTFRRDGVDFAVALARRTAGGPRLRPRRRREPRPLPAVDGRPDLGRARARGREDRPARERPLVARGRPPLLPQQRRRPRRLPPLRAEALRRRHADASSTGRACGTSRTWRRAGVACSSPGRRTSTSASSTSSTSPRAP